MEPLLAQMLDARKQLLNTSVHRAAPLMDWVPRLDAAESVLVQVGANAHKRHGYDNGDPGPVCTQRGWRSLLIEPSPNHFEMLRKQYDGHQSVRLLNAAVCGATCNAHEKKTFWSVDLSNKTDPDGWGSNHSDPRCALVPGGGWVSEIASLSRGHLIASAKIFGFTPAKCNRCSQLVGRELPPNCMDRLVMNRIVAHQVPCGCLATEVSVLRATRPVTLLMIDAEGYDAEVLKQYPFDRIPTWRVVYETSHLSTDSIRSSAKLMMSHGFVNLLGGLAKLPMTMWHHRESAECTMGACGRGPEEAEARSRALPPRKRTWQSGKGIGRSSAPLAMGVESHCYSSCT